MKCIIWTCTDQSTLEQNEDRVIYLIYVFCEAKPKLMYWIFQCSLNYLYLHNVEIQEGTMNILQSGSLRILRVEGGGKLPYIDWWEWLAQGICIYQ